MKLTKADLIRTVENRLNLSNKRATQVVHTIVGAIVRSLADGQEARIADFGRFFVKQRAARAYRVPGGGAPIQRGPCNVVQFSAYGRLNERVATLEVDDLERLSLEALPAERRQSGRAPLPDIGSAIVRISGIPVCEFKIKDISDNGSALWAEEDSVMLRNIAVGQEIDIRINHLPDGQDQVMQRARIVHISKSRLPDRLGYCVIGVEILGKLPV
ncbi:MAG: HU family DNA-binding protein [Desulfobacteraceae bacterium]|nr:HU family DNA-binding protein [Desulfobacteraceae bacterium]